MSTLEQQIEQKQLELNRLKQKQEKAETRKKIIVGAMILKECQTNANLARIVNDLINRSKITEKDKKLLESTIKELENVYQQPIQTNTNQG